MADFPIAELAPIETVGDNILSLDEIPDYVEKPKGTRETDDLFYAAASYSEDPVNEYKKALVEKQTTGESTLVKMAEQKWQEEQNDTAKAVLTQFIADPNVDNIKKRAALQSYVLGNFISKDLRNRYLVSAASVDNALTELDRQAQNIYGSIVHERDQAAQLKEAQELEEKGKIKFESVVKGIAGVGSQLLAMVPAGLYGLAALIDEQDPVLANKVIQEALADLAYTPTDEGAQKVMEKAGKVLETLDIPFQWFGNKTLDITGSPGAATAVYTGTSFAGYIGAAKLAGKVVKGRPQVRAETPAGATASASRSQAGELGAAAVVDQTGEVAKALGTTKEALVTQWTLPKIEDEFGRIHPDLRARLDKIDQELESVYQQTQVSPYLVPVSEMEADLAKFGQILREESGPYWQQANSLIKMSDEAIEGKAILGRNADFGYDTELAAQNALNAFKTRLNDLPEADRGTATLVELEGQKYIQWEFKKEYDPFQKLAMGDDSLSAKFFGMDVTQFANSAVGKWILPSYMRMKESIPTSGALANWKTYKIEDTYLRNLRDSLVNSKFKEDLNSVIRKGELEGKDWTTADFDRMYPHFSKSDRGQLQYEYLAYTRIRDAMYKIADRKFMRDLDREGYQVVYDNAGNRLGFVSSRIKPDEPIKKVWDFDQKKIVDIDPESQKQLVKMKDPQVFDNQVLEYAYVGNQKLAAPHPGLLSRIPGYVPRDYKIYWAVDRIPNELYKNGQKVLNTELHKFKKAVGGDKTKKKAEQLAARLQQEYPGYTFKVRQEQRRIEDQIIMDSHVYDSYFREGHKRGEPLSSFKGEAELEDILVSTSKSIRSLSRLVGWDSIMHSARTNWIKAYGEFTNGRFPDQVNEIIPHRHMDLDQQKLYNNAVEIYKQLRFQSRADELLSDVAWKATITKIADVTENIFPSSWIRELAEKGNIPIKAAASLPRHMWLYLRPARQWVVQPSQGLELLAVDPTFIGEVAKISPIMFGLLAKHSPIMKSFKPAVDYVGKTVEPEYAKIVDTFYDAGILQTVDTNALIHGLFRDPTSPLIKGGIEAGLEKAKSGLQLPSKIGRKIGYDSAELMNQVMLWLFSKHQWQKKNPGKDWSKPENAAEISGYAWRLGHGPSGRAGMMPWQEGLVGTFLQFAAIPHKGMVQTFSAKELTGAQKAKLAAGRMFWYGVYGVPLGLAIDKLFQEYSPEEYRDSWENWKSGIVDKLINKTINVLSDDEVGTDLAIAKSTTTLPETPFVWELGKALFDMSFSTDYSENHKFPFQSGYSAVFDTARTMYDVFTVPDHDVNSEEFWKTMEKGLSLAAGYNDYLLKEQIETYKDRLDKGGAKYGLHLSLAEAEWRLWTGIPTKKESRFWEIKQDDKKRTQYIKDGAKEIWNRMYRIEGVLGSPTFTEEMKRLNDFLAGYYPQTREEIISEFFKYDKERYMNQKESVLFRYMQLHSQDKDKYVQDMTTKLKAMNDPEGNKILEVLEKEGLM